MAEGRAASSTRVPLIVAIVLVLVLGIGGVLAGSKKKSSKRGAAPAGTRAVIVPAGARPLTFVIPPCGTGRTIRAADADKQRTVKGAAVFQLPARCLRRLELGPVGPFDVLGERRDPALGLAAPALDGIVLAPHPVVGLV